MNPRVAALCRAQCRMNLSLPLNALRAAVGGLVQSIDALRTILATMDTGSVVSPVEIEETTEPFRTNSVELHTRLSKEERQAQGIFFTPKPIRARLFEVLELHGVRPKTILEPSFGSGEFLYDAALKYPSAKLYGVEKNPAVFASVRLPTASLVNADFLACPPTPVDLVLGNPPYFVTKAKDPACMTGRGNIYVQFVYTCLMNHLTPGGDSEHELRLQCPLDMQVQFGLGDVADEGLDLNGHRVLRWAGEKIPPGFFRVR